MGSWLTLLVTVMTLLFSSTVPGQVHAQPAPANTPFKEVQIGASAFSLGEPVPSWVEPTAIPNTDQTQAVVMRLADAQYLVGSTPVVYVHRALLINDAASLTSAGQVTIGFVPQYHQLKVHTLRVLRAGESLDRSTSSTIRFLQRERGLEQGVYSGEVTASILVNDLRVGDTLELAYSLHGLNPVFGNKFVDGASWDQRYPTLLRRVTLNSPADRQVAWRMIGDREAKPVVPKETVQGGMRRLVFEEQPMAKVVPEPLTPPDYPAYRWLQFSEFTGWDDVAAWARDLFQLNEGTNADLREIVENLRKKPTEEERVVAALEFVQSEIRYFSVSIGESSHRPTQPDVALQHRYGDCKDKSLLLLTLLQALGIQSKPVLLEIGRRKGLDKALPSPHLFNHAIVQVTVAGNVYYLDPTRLGQHGRLRRMGQVHEGAQVLVVAPETRQLTTIATANIRELAHSEVAETAQVPKLDAEAEGALQVRQVWHGVVAEGLRVTHERMPHDQVVATFANLLESRYPGAKLIGEPDIQDDRVNNVVSITTRYSVPKLAIEREGNWFVRFLPGNLKGTLATSASATRVYPLYLPVFPYDAKYTFEVTFPEQVSVVSDPRTVAVKNKHFTYAVTSSFRGNVAKSTIQLTTLADQVQVADLQKYTEDARSIGTITAAVVAVPKSAIKPAALSARAAKKDFAQTLRDRLQETVDKTTQAIKSGKLAGSDLAGSHCLRGEAYSSLGKAAEALADANEAVKLAPNSSTALSCRAHVHFSAGEFEKSIADYSRAITLGATDATALHLRGIVKFYAGKLEEAAEDLLRASETDDREGQVGNDLWLAWTYRRLGRPLPEPLIQRAAEQPRGDWPRPALAVLTGHLTPEEMLKLLERKTGDDRRMALSEAYFYLGQYYLGRGDKAKARNSFEETRRQNVLIYTEHIAAAFELKHLLIPAETGALPGSPATKSPAAPVADPAVPGGPIAAPPDPKKGARKPAGKTQESWRKDVWRQ
jgi:lipoprotein NlpI